MTELKSYAAKPKETPMSIDNTAIVEALHDCAHPYHALAVTLAEAFEQAATGKGKERHANDLPFTRQRMQTIAQGMGTEAGLIYQACKKSQESMAMDEPAAARELAGAIVYLAGAIIYRRS